MKGGRGRAQGALDLLLTSPWALCWWKPALVCRLVFSCTPRPRNRQPQTVDCFATPNRLPMVSHRQHIRVFCTESLPRGPRTDTPSVQLPKQHIQREILADTRPCWGKICFMWPALAQQLVHCGWGWSSQSASPRILHTYECADSSQDSIIIGGPT